jgi:hypothetical protein
LSSPLQQALEAKKSVLKLHEAQPFLDSKEKKAITNFMGSESWAKKLLDGTNSKRMGHEVRN